MRPPVLELRVHGVVDSAPTTVLDHERPERLIGEYLSGFDRRPDDRRNDLEAYSWSGFATRTGTRAAWILLAPFAFANVAGWLLPFEPRDAPAGVAQWQKAFVRVAAALVTVLVVLGVWVIAVDLVAYQCGGQPSCAGGLPGLEALGVSNPARRIAIAMTAPVAAVALLAYLGRRSRMQFEEHQPKDKGDEEEVPDPALVLGMRDAQFWHSSDFVRRLARLHVAAGLTAIALVTSLALWRLERASPESSAWESVDLVLLTTSILWTMELVFFLSMPRLAHARIAQALQGGAAALVAFVAVAGVVRGGPAAIGGGLRVGPPVVEGSRLFDHAHVTAASGSFLLLLLGSAVLGFAGRRAARPAKPEDAGGGFGTLGPFVLMSVAGASVALLVAPAVGWAARWLNRTSSPVHPIGYSAVFDWVVVLAVVAGGLFVTAWVVRTALLAFGRNGWRAERWAQEFDLMYGGGPDLPDDCASTEIEPCHQEQRPAMVRLVARKWRRRTAGSASGLVTRLVVLTVLGLAVIITVRAGEGLPPLPSELSPLLVVIVIGSALYIGIRRLRGLQPNPEVSSRIAELATWWDAATLWPRWFHPLGPPGLGVRAVPELVRRLEYLTQPLHGVAVPTVVAGHGTGSVLAAAAVMRLRDPGVSRVAMVTVGSPLRRVYGRYFPVYFDSAELRKVQASLRDAASEGWSNLYRLTDQLGGAVFGEAPFGEIEHGPPADPVDVLLLDPLTDHHEPGDPCPSPLGHRGYFSTPPPCLCPPYDDVVAVLKKVLAERVDGGATAPPSPTSAAPSRPSAGPGAAGPGTAGT